MVHTLLSFEEFINYLHIGRSTGYKLLKAGAVQGKRVGKKWVISLEDIEKYLKDK